MSEQKLDPELRQAIIDRLTGWELVDFLQIGIEDVVDAFEDEILDALDDVRDFVGVRNDREIDEESE